MEIQEQTLAILVTPPVTHALHPPRPAASLVLYLTTLTSTHVSARAQAANTWIQDLTAASNATLAVIPVQTPPQPAAYLVGLEDYYSKILVYLAALPTPTKIHLMKHVNFAIPIVSHA